MSRQNTRLLRNVLLAAILAPAPMLAEGDLDLLASGQVPPNVMLVLDNSGSMETALGGSTRIEVAGDALKNLIQDLYPADGSGGYTAKARLGLARFDPTGTMNGGQIMQSIASNNKSALLTSIDQIVSDRLAPFAPGTGTPLSEALVDVGRYFAGQYGFGTYPAVSNTSPIDLVCRGNFVVFISDGEPNQDQNNHYGSSVFGTTAYQNFVDTIGNADGDANECSSLAPATCINSPRSGRDDGFVYASASGTDWFDDVAYYLANTDFVPDATLAGEQSIRTYTIGFTTTNVLLEETALNGRGEYVTANDATELATSLSSSFDSIFANVRTAFNSAVVPGSSIGSGNALYNSYFVSSDEAVWEGHLEALRISPSGQIQDANLDPAVDPVTGNLVPARVPYWDAADRLAADTSRTLYTTKAGARVDFTKTEVTATDLGVTLAEVVNYPNHPASGVTTLTALEDAIVDYLHGRDAFDEDGDSDSTELRDIVFGDIFHSTPRAVAAPTRFTIHEPGYLAFYNAYKERDRVVYTGANDGMLHAFDAGQFMTGDDPATPELEASYYTPGLGDEVFGWIPGHQLGRVKRLPLNAPRIDHFVDGPISVFDAWLGDGSGTDVTKTADEWATVLVTGYREGGSGYMALDVTDPSAGAAAAHGPYPKLLWEFSDSDLGQSWSEAVIARVKLAGALGSGDNCGIADGDGDCREQWVAIFSGGYAADGDPNRSEYVADPTDASWRDVGKAIYVVALDTGAILAKVEFDATGANGPAEMKYAIPSTPAVLDLDFDGFVDVVYVGDLGGQVWKWDLHALGTDTDADPQIDNWPAGRFFATAPVAVSGGNHYRSFFFPPVATYLNGKLVLAFGSGERHDLDYPGDGSAADENRFYVAKDPVPYGTGAFATTLTDADLTDITALDFDNDPTDAGFRMDLTESEKFVTNVSVFAGYVIVGSYTPVPSSDLCATASGQSFLHVFSIRNGRGLFEDPADPPNEDRREFVGGGLPSDPTVIVGQNPDDDVILIKTSEGPRVVSVEAPPRDDSIGSLIYWRKQL